MRLLTACILFCSTPFLPVEQVHSKMKIEKNSKRVRALFVIISYYVLYMRVSAILLYNWQSTGV